MALSCLAELRPAARARGRRRRGLAGLALVAWAGTAAGDATLAGVLQASLPGESPERVHQLLEEKFVLLPDDDPEAADAGRVRALVLFAQPQPRVLQLLVQTGRQTEYRRDLDGLRVVEQLPDREVDEHDMKILLTRISFWLRYQFDFATGRIAWSLDPRFPNQMRVVEGSWELQPLDPGHTLARFATRIDVGPALPSFLQTLATRKNLPATLDRVRRWVDSDGRYRP